eukprot:gene11769-13892_t
MEARSRLPARSTRGQRLSALVEDDQEADEEFWGQDAFAEEEEDNEYKTESEAEDVVDEDFYKSESSEDDEEVVVEKEKRKKTLAPPGSKPKPKVAKMPYAREKNAVGADPGGRLASPIAKKTRAGTAVLGETPIAQRKSKRSAAEAANEARTRLMDIRKAQKKVAQKRIVEDRALTQEEMLVEAAQTELLNQASLKQLEAMDEETKRKAVVQKDKYQGPMI